MTLPGIDFSEIKKHRLKLGLSQKEVAEKLNISQSSLSYIEKGKYKELGISLVVSLANILNVHFDELFPSIEYKAKKEIESLKLTIVKLEAHNKLLLEQTNFLERTLDVDIDERESLKRFTQYFNLVNIFMICDIDFMYKLNPEFINEKRNVNHFLVLRFLKKYGPKANFEIYKYLDIEKFKNSSNLDFISIRNEKNELMTENEIVEWINNFRQKHK